jgi:hypothetical protein
MGRGLSELQRYILTKAAADRRGQVCYPAILTGFFGWEKKRPFQWKFQPLKIGEGKYRSDKASLSRSCCRLKQRGLVKRAHRYALEITATGREWLSARAGS